MSYMLELMNGTEIEVSNTTYIKVKIESAAMMLGVAATLGDKPEQQREFVEGAKIAVSDALDVLHER